jgi:flavin-binding protein dodecin
MDWFEVVEQRGKIADGKVTEFQVTFKVGSRSSARINIAIAQA